MLNFTVGPVMMQDELRSMGAEQIPYFRTNEFSDIMLENEVLMKEFANAGKTSKCVFITGSGTASMEAAIMNVFNQEDKVLVVNGGSFGHRFVEILEIHNIPYEEIVPEYGYGITEQMLEKYDNKGFTGFVVNGHETSTGVLYDLKMISEFCKKNNLIYVVDAISMFLADSFDMEALGADIMITGSQKALACPPGVSIILLSERAVDRVQNNKTTCMYLDLKRALLDAQRGQTPFTPAVGILLQINKRLNLIKQSGGVTKETEAIAAIAKDFREKIKELPFEIVSHSLSNAVTPLKHINPAVSAKDIFRILKDEYQIWICPNGGEYADKIFRVGHIGALTYADNDTLIDALKDMQKRDLI